MAMSNIKSTKKIDKEKPLDAETPVLKALDEVAEDESPILKSETDGSLEVVGDPKKIDTPDNDTVYDLTFVLPKEEFDPADFADVKDYGDFFTVNATATQEPIRPYNRGYFAEIALQFILNFFEVKDDKTIELKESNDLTRAVLNFYKDETLIAGTHIFVSKMLDLDSDLGMYLNERQMITIAADLVVKNPSLINSAYYEAK